METSLSTLLTHEGREDYAGAFRIYVFRVVDVCHFKVSSPRCMYRTNAAGRRTEEQPPKRGLFSWLVLLVVLTALGGTTLFWRVFFPTHFADTVASLRGRVGPTERKAIVRKLVESRDEADERDAPRKAAFAAVRDGKLVPRPDLGPCPLILGPPTDPTEKWHLFAATSHAKVDQDNLGESAYARRVAMLARTIERDLAEGGERSFVDAHLEELAQLEPPARDFTLVVLEKRDARLTGKREMGRRLFDGGELLGVLYVWDAEAEAIVCAAIAYGQSSDEVKTVHVPGGPKVDKIVAGLDLARDMRENAVIDGMERLVRVGPPVEEE